MLPFQSNLSQFIADAYASTAFFQPIYLYPNQESCWGALNFPDHSNAAHSLLQHDLQAPPKPAEATSVGTKTKRTREKINQESSASCQSGGQESQDSPDFKSRQKYGRNINSNIFHQMLKAIRSEEGLEGVVERVLESGRFQITKKQFQDMLHKRLSKLNPYVTNAKMGSFLNGVSRIKLPQSREISRTELDFFRVLRAMCRYYLSNVHLLYVFNKLKLQKQSKAFHISGIRKILEVMIA